MNAFLQKSELPDWRIMMDNPSDAIPALKTAISEASENISAIKSLEDSKLTFENSIRALDRSTLLLDKIWTALNHLQSVADSDSLRDAITKTTPEVSEFYSNIYIDEILYSKIAAFAASDKARSLSGDQKRLLEETLLDFEESGANLPKEKKRELVEIDKELTLKTQKFSENVLDSTMAFVLHITDSKDLSGLPPTAVALASKKAEQKGLKGWCFTLEQPSYVPFMEYADSQELRKRMWEAFTSVASSGKFDNYPLISEILELRKRKSIILGESSFADMILKRRMAKDGKTALNFISELHDKFESAFIREGDSLKNFAVSRGYLKDGDALNPWDVPYFSEKMRQSECDFDAEALRPYFPLDAVLGGMFKIFGILFGVSVREEPLTAPAWDDSVRLYSVSDKSGSKLGFFYADFFPRTVKRSGAWMNMLSPSFDGTPAAGIIAANISEGVNGVPPLLSHDEVETLFHEFGHLIHFFLMDSPELGLREVAWDFVELPSQIMENWTKNRDALNIFAKHWQSGAPIPQSLYDAYKRAEKFMGASGAMRQLSFAKIDLEMHIHPELFIGKNIEAAAEEILKPYTRKLSVKVPSILPRFTHLFGDSVGYAAGYYSYKWAEVLDADAFSKFEAEGILNPKVGGEFAQKILRVGNSVDPQMAFQDFMGRPPKLDALVARTIN